MADINAVAKQFTDFYYQSFDTNRSQLSPLYVCHLSFASTPQSLIFLARDIDAYVRGDPDSRRGCYHREADGKVLSDLKLLIVLNNAPTAL
jgi:hypothetical protein